MTAACRDLTSDPDFRILPDQIRALVSDLTSSPEVRRLQEISFLGAIDRSPDDENRLRSGSRFDHSIGVTALLLRLRSTLPFSEGEFGVALAHGLLHDIGHGPYSHSSEPFFRTVFGIDHHLMLVRTIEDACSSVSVVLRKRGLWHDYRRFINKPQSLPALNTLFSAPINVDTIEGILRAARFFGIQSPVEASEVVHSLRRKTMSVKPLDLFWSLKGEVYNEHIFGKKHGPADRLLTATLFSVRDKLRIEDFRLTDVELEQRLLDLEAEVLFDLSSDEGRRQRHFTINAKVVPTRLQSLSARYLEVKPRHADHSGVSKIYWKQAQ